MKERLIIGNGKVEIITIQPKQSLYSYVTMLIVVDTPIPLTQSDGQTITEIQQEAEIRVNMAIQYLQSEGFLQYKTCKVNFSILNALPL